MIPLSSLQRVIAQLPFIYQCLRTPKKDQDETMVSSGPNASLSVNVKIGNLHEGTGFELVFDGHGNLRMVVQQKYCCTNHQHNGQSNRPDLLVEIQAALQGAGSWSNRLTA